MSNIVFFNKKSPPPKKIPTIGKLPTGITFNEESGFYEGTSIPGMDIKTNLGWLRLTGRHKMGIHSVTHDEVVHVELFCVRTKIVRYVPATLVGTVRLIDSFVD